MKFVELTEATYWDVFLLDDCDDEVDDDGTNGDDDCADEKDL